jgi:hypothetical protein
MPHKPTIAPGIVSCVDVIGFRGPSQTGIRELELTQIGRLLRERFSYSAWGSPLAPMLKRAANGCMAQVLC